eukprot:364133-Chlamydomonas_euryale.AAC.12
MAGVALGAATRHARRMPMASAAIVAAARPDRCALRSPQSTCIGAHEWAAPRFLGCLRRPGKWPLAALLRHDYRDAPGAPRPLPSPPTGPAS